MSQKDCKERAERAKEEEEDIYSGTNKNRVTIKGEEFRVTPRVSLTYFLKD